MSSLVGKSVSSTERDTTELSEVSGFSTVPAYLNKNAKSKQEKKAKIRHGRRRRGRRLQLLL
jgi:hypothetical protein